MQNRQLWRNGAGLLRAPAPLLAILAAAGAACDDPGEVSRCDPPCAAHELCVNGLCEPIDAQRDVFDAVDIADVEPQRETPNDIGEAEAAPEDIAPEGRDAGASNIGEPCRRDSDCHAVQDPTCLRELTVLGRTLEWPGGYCTAPCDPTDPDSCGQGALCLSVPLADWDFCVRECRPGVPGDCREDEGYSCVDPGGFFDVPAPFCAPPLRQ